METSNRSVTMNETGAYDDPTICEMLLKNVLAKLEALKEENQQLKHDLKKEQEAREHETKKRCEMQDEHKKQINQLNEYIRILHEFAKQKDELLNSVLGVNKNHSVEEDIYSLVDGWENYVGILPRNGDEADPTAEMATGRRSLFVDHLPEQVSPPSEPDSMDETLAKRPWIGTVNTGVFPPPIPPERKVSTLPKNMNFGDNKAFLYSPGASISSEPRGINSLDLSNEGSSFSSIESQSEGMNSLAAQDNGEKKKKKKKKTPRRKTVDIVFDALPFGRK